jgi:hypothetical protein
VTRTKFINTHEFINKHEIEEPKEKAHDAAEPPRKECPISYIIMVI